MWFFSILLNLAFAQTPRISSTNHNLSAVDKIYVSAGLVSVLEFPQNIIEVRVGDVSSVKAIISQTSPKELTVYLSNSAAKASNLIVRAEKKVYVFDIVPSTTSHQDYIKIKGSFGSPNFSGTTSNFQSVKIEPQSKKEDKCKLVSNQKITVEP